MTRSTGAATPALRGLVLVASLLLPAALGATPDGDPGYRILVTNDDGFQAPGLHALVRELAGLGEVVVSAPSRNRSGASQAFEGFGGGITVYRVDVPGAGAAWAVDGTPANAASFGLLYLARRRPFSLIVSGVNDGANVGWTAHYSGTVGAAKEGALRGIPAIAISQDKARADGFALAARYAARFARRLLARPRVPLVVYSINVPAGQPQGVKVGAMFGSLLDLYDYRWSSDLEWSDGTGLITRFTMRVASDPEVTRGDAAAYRRGFVTITSLRFDWTHDEAMIDLARWKVELEEPPCAEPVTASGVVDAC